MSWVRFGDEVPDLPAVWSLSHGAFRLHFSGLAYANRMLLDCRVPASRLPALMPDFRPALVAELVDAGLWMLEGETYRIVLSAEHQLTRERVEQIRADRAEAGRIGGQRSGEARREASRQANAEAPAKQPASPQRSKREPRTPSREGGEENVIPFVPSSVEPKVTATDAGATGPLATRLRGVAGGTGLTGTQLGRLLHLAERMPIEMLEDSVRAATRGGWLDHEIGELEQLIAGSVAAAEPLA